MAQWQSPTWSEALSEFTCLLGGSAFSEYQRQKLTQSLCMRTGLDIQMEAKFMYFVES